MGIISAILKALASGFNVWNQEREIRNRPEMTKAKLQEAHQEATDRLRAAYAVLVNPKCTPEQHAEALRSIRLADS